MRFDLELLLHLLLLLLMAAALPSGAVSSSRVWMRGFDNLSDYEETFVRLRVVSARLCLARVSGGARVATFDKADGTCREFRCLLGQPDCRKCRSTSGGGAGAASLTEVWTPMPYADQCWITVQHRVSDSVDFYRNWADYKAGFGEGPAGNFWIGLDSLHSLTNLANNKRRRLRLAMKSWSGIEGWIDYAYFHVGPESSNYQLNLSSSEFVSSQPGNWNAMGSNSGQGFSTMDVNNDICGNRNYNCAARFHGAWWFKCCSSAYPNGKYYNSPEALNTDSWNGIVWSTQFGSKYSLMEFEMLVS